VRRREPAAGQALQSVKLTALAPALRLWGEEFKDTNPSLTSG